jgi:ribosomal protein S18 acetylase RimI-like enzyme
MINFTFVKTMQVIQVTSNEQLQIVADLAKRIWPVAYATILSNEQLHYMLDRFYNLEALQKQLENGQVFYLAQNENQEFVGFVSYEINCEPNKTKIHKIYVLPETQGTGIGKQLFELVKTKAQENQQTAIFLNVNKYNNAQNFYQKLGFTITKEEVIDIGNGYVMDDYVMEIVV